MSRQQNIAHRADGGFTTKDHVALVHKNEGIIPLQKVPEIFAKTLCEYSAEWDVDAHVPNVNLTVNIHGAANTEEFRQKVIPLLRPEIVSLFEEMRAALNGSP